MLATNMASMVCITRKDEWLSPNLAVREGGRTKTGLLIPDEVRSKRGATGPKINHLRFAIAMGRIARYESSSISFVNNVWKFPTP